MDEINAEDEIREAFKVFDSVRNDEMVLSILKILCYRMETGSLTDRSLDMSWRTWERKWRRKRLSV